MEKEEKTACKHARSSLARGWEGPHGAHCRPFSSFFLFCSVLSVLREKSPLVLQVGTPTNKSTRTTLTLCWIRAWCRALTSSIWRGPRLPRLTRSTPRTWCKQRILHPLFKRTARAPSAVRHRTCGWRSAMDTWAAEGCFSTAVEGVGLRFAIIELLST